MTNTSFDILNIENFEDFEAGQSGSFKIDEGSYEGLCVGTTIAKREFEGKERIVVRLIWQLNDGEHTHTIRGNDWSISASENSKFRQEISKWFNKTDWGEVCKLLIKAGVIVKNEDNSARVVPEAFIGKRAKLLIANKKTKKGADFPVIASMSPSKAKGNTFELDEVPWFMVEGDEILSYTLMQGITIRAKKEDENSQPNPALAHEYTQTPTAPGQFVGKQFVPPVPQGAQSGNAGAFFGQQPTQQPNPANWPPAATPIAPNPTAPQPQYQPATTPAGNTYAAQQAPQVEVDSDDDLPF